jgi:hypothetical protein
LGGVKGEEWVGQGTAYHCDQVKWGGTDKFQGISLKENTPFGWGQPYGPRIAVSSQKVIFYDTTLSWRAAFVRIWERGSRFFIYDLNNSRLPTLTKIDASTLLLNFQFIPMFLETLVYSKKQNSNYWSINFIPKNGLLWAVVPFIVKSINRQRFKIEETLDRRTTKFLFILYKKRSQDCYKKKHIQIQPQ